MPTMNVTVLRKEDPPVWGDVANGSALHPNPETPWQLAISEAGMSSGAPSIALRMDLPDGKVLIAETSLGAWLMATAAFRGAFPEAFVGTLFEGQAGGHMRHVPDADEAAYWAPPSQPN